MEGSVTTGEHVEFARRVDEHFRNIDTRLNVIDEEMKSYSKLAISIEKISMATNQLCQEIKKQGERLELLEDRDGEKWRSTVSTVVTVAIGAIMGYLFSLIGIAA